jgi:nucleotide-binding universal stress UspA family protein
MYHHILIPTDGSELSDKAISHGVALSKAIGANVIFVTVTAPLVSLGDKAQMFEGIPEPMRKQALDYLYSRAREALGSASNAATIAGVPSKAVEVEHRHPYEAIIATARQEGCDLIVMASHGRRGAGALLLGSETTKVLTHSKIPVLVCR